MLTGTINPALSVIDTGHPGNGICAYFYDATYEFYPGGIGSSLGYTNYVGHMAHDASTLGAAASASVNGIRGAYAGIGFDIVGDFSTSRDGKVGKTASTVLQYTNYTGISSTRDKDLAPNSLCVRMSEPSGYRVHCVSPSLFTYK